MRHSRVILRVDTGKVPPVDPAKSTSVESRMGASTDGESAA
jgi:hypothetical protein